MSRIAEIGAAVVGTGFVAREHLEALRRFHPLDRHARDLLAENGVSDNRPPTGGCARDRLLLERPVRTVGPATR